MREFNLIDSDWIPCSDIHGTISEYSLKYVLSQASNLSEVLDSSPIITLTLYRLLLALLHRALQGPRTLSEWKHYFSNGWAKEVESYLANERIYRRFFLFNDAMPFLQESRLVEENNQMNQDSQYSAEPVPLATIARELSASRNPTLFDHTVDKLPARFTAAHAARLVVADQFYAMPDGAGYVTSQSTYGINVLVRGENLFETLMYNLLIYNGMRPIISDLSRDKPSWEISKAIRETDIPTGYLDYLTWPHRRLKLIHEKPLTHVLRNKHGPKINKEWRERNPDPMLFYRISEDHGYQAVHLREERALWRDAHSLILLVRNRTSLEPGFVNLIARLGKPQKGLIAIGTSSNQNKIFFWRHERLPLPSHLLVEDEVLEAIRRSLIYAEDVANALRVAVYTLVLLLSEKSNNREKEGETASGFSEKNDRNPHKKKDPIGDLYKSLGSEGLYWQRLENPFNLLLYGLPTNTGNENQRLLSEDLRLAEWTDSVYAAARQSFRTVCNKIGVSSPALKAGGRAESIFRKRINGIPMPYLKYRAKGGEEA